MSDREDSEMEIEEAKKNDPRRESTSMEETEGQDTDLRTREADDRTDWRHKRDPRSSAEKRDNATQMRHELGQSSEYPVRTGVADCYYYLKNGGCFFGRSCRYNHPPRNQLGDDTVQPSAYKVRLGATNCEQYLHTGQCTYGSRCWFNHPPLPGARDCEQYLQTGQCSYGRRCRFNHPLTHLAPATTWGRRSDERRHETESSSRAEKRARTIPDYPSVIQDVSDEVGAGQNSWLQRRRAQRGKIDCGQRRVSEEERTLRETVPCTVLVLYSQERQTHDLEEQKQRERVYENLRIDQIKASVQSDGGIQTEQRLEIPENHSVNAQENLQEQADVEKEKRKAQEKAQEERSRSLTGNVDQLIQSLQDNIGIGRKKGDGV
ncbi:putative zinc finger CCCH domain-containing protein 9 isoform X3 [Brassica rapa]|uniref:putative zinc finger CCCH domain-containing protein 9 isoform X3 n=1 Tax=Brassica campestris TaxID=3711 RepID=UPI000872D122|nr:putative zinc finger CCCH domain-containing protein 9 isoform X3 [Brassica rapa]